MDQQLHGYRNGHQLLSATTTLSRGDQDVIDRLSDVAGPLRPGEMFEPYITCYPVPSATYYVVARTWQDLSAPRAGCVRTRSQLIPMEDWRRGVDLFAILDQLSKDGPIESAAKRKIYVTGDFLDPIPFAENIELVEAIFLEERKPIVVFDAQNAELLAMRLLTSFWPSFRQSFALSTYALSPRLLGRRFFDLVFCPGDARSRFSDWAGRRIDARKQASSRHRWSQEIATRIFSDVRPSLLREDVLGELTSEKGGTEAELRISLLWNELYGKLQSSPNAVLGLLDIANSRAVRNMAAIKKIEPEIGSAARRASTMLPTVEAWRFLLALLAKLHDVRLKLSIAKSIRAAAIDLADRAPAEALANVHVLSSVKDQEFLLGAIGEGLASHFDADRAEALLQLSPSDLLKMLMLSPALAEVSLHNSHKVVSKVASALERASSASLFEAKRRLLRLFVDDAHFEVAKILFAELDELELMEEVRHLDKENGLAAHSFHGALATRAEEIHVVRELRNVVASLSDGEGSDSLLIKLLSPIQADLLWILRSKDLKDSRRVQFVRVLIKNASERQFRTMLAGPEVESVLSLLMRDPKLNLAIIDRILEIEELSVAVLVHTTKSISRHVDTNTARRFSLRALGVLLSREMMGRREALAALLETVGSSVDGAWIYRTSLQRDVGSKLLSENLEVLDSISSDTRESLMENIGAFSSALLARGKIDFSPKAAAAIANLMWDSGIKNEAELLKASTALLPLLWRSPGRAASPLISVAFPVVYRNYKDSELGPDLFSLFFFADWDKCKTLRRELLVAFSNSKWSIADIALAAARSGDVDRIVRLIGSMDADGRVIEKMHESLELIPIPWRTKVAGALKSMGKDKDSDEDLL
ncbi:hypothetical protein [Herbaspirillum robiniae]|uniref:GAP1-N1 domain-containing protein n=1 Tax=Herbaspirillum robiniae TaxID=2014887 RepID=UPI00101AE9A8|nr:hypothetical protein [Herbaspirillum robiniae]